MAEDTASAILKDEEALGLREEKKTEDFSAQADALIQRVEQARQASLQGRRSTEGLRGAQVFGDEILALEKKCRQAQDGASGSRLCACYLRCFVKVQDAEKKEIVLDPEAELLVDALDPETLENVDKEEPGCTVTFSDARGVEAFAQEVIVLIKRRGQLKRSICAVIRFSMQLLKYLKPTDKAHFIESLKTATEGKIFVEVERARLILLSALMKEKAGKVEEAALMLQDVQVETFGAMEREEKTKYILKQMVLLLRRSDYIRCQIVSKKLSPKLLEAADLHPLKIKFYELMTLYYLHENALLDVAKCFGHIYNTQSIQDDPAKMKECLEFFAIFMVLAPYDKEAKELIEKTLKEEIKKLQQLPTFEQLLKDLSGVELLSWPLPYDEHLHNHAAFGDEKFAGGAKRWTLLRKRVIQHNLRVLSEHYSVIELQRVASLLGIDEEEAEKELSELASGEVLDAKIDRPARTVAFGKPKTDLVVLDEWSSSLSKYVCLRLLDKVDLCCHMIQKERMVHAARAKAAAANARIAS
ncbi:26S proteasome non-ATPase regulatory subunit, putative [Eimeria acervulina]|uniref:26S proteasome non-ATPase regulatory subunit, putative n=1 Tax=Eimeria acervulina TaxID=5801 RepID=U6GFI0_EIMAC|nr:26S proteasome non-ATPase regulatory subunit, putative [Eimeria acervulina]CDI78322.1 26S proteasome non-ATPase regulatory subunit, putative [Eimeria acervulina]